MDVFRTGHGLRETQKTIPTGDHDLQELAVLLNVPDERIVPALSELSEIGFLTIKEADGIFHLNLW